MLPVLPDLYANVQLVKHERDIVTVVIYYYTTTEFQYAKRDSLLGFRYLRDCLPLVQRVYDVVTTALLIG